MCVVFCFPSSPIYPEEEADEENVMEDDSETNLNKVEDDFLQVQEISLMHPLINHNCNIGVNPGGLGGVAIPTFWRGGSQGRSLRSWTGCETLLYLIMYRQYVQKW